MAFTTIREITKICRFCLSEDDELLIAASTIIDSSLNVQSVEMITGVQVRPNEISSFVICIYCRNKLRQSVAFRKLCLSNDRLYKQLFPLSLGARDSNSVHRKPGLVSTQFPQLQVSINENFHNLSGDIDQQHLAGLNGEETVSSIDSIDCIDFNDSSQSCDAEPDSKSIHGINSRKTCSQTVEYDCNDIEPQHDQTAKEKQFIIDGDYQNSPSNVVSNVSIWPYQPKQLCDICGQMVNNFKRHVLSHTKDARYACPHCPIKMTDSSNLVRHIQSVHLKIVVKSCDTCGKGFTHYNTYHTHMRSQHGVGETYECKICCKHFTHPGGVREHFKRVHNNESKFECTTCRKRFKTRKAWKIHERVHSTNQPYACNQCPKKFKSGFARNTHQLTHSGIVFSCKLCHKSYRYKALLNMHVRKFHNDGNGDSENDEFHIG